MTAVVVLMKKLDEMRENRWLLATAAMVVGLMSTMTLAIARHGLPGYADYAAALVLFSTIGTALLVIASYLVQTTMQRRKNAFFAHFELEHPRSSKEIKIMQYAVESRLRELARNLREACHNEEAFLENDVAIKGAAEVKAAREKLGEFQWRIKNAKGNFWEARNIAQLFGFKVQSKAKEYWR